MESTLECFFNKLIMSNYSSASYMPEQYRGNIFHYTSAAGFSSILFSSSNDIILWSSRYDCLNDKSEGIIVLSLYNEVCNELHEDGIISSDFYNDILDITIAKTQLFMPLVNGRIKPTRPEYERYVTSFSKNSDSLSMWNYYSKGNKYEGYNIGFLSESLKRYFEEYFNGQEVNVKIYPVIYSKMKQKQLIKKLILKMYKEYEPQFKTSLRYIISNQLLDWELIFKSEYFQHEEEIRIIVDMAKRTKNGELQPRPIGVKYRYNCGLQIPYIELKIKKEELKTINIGPLQYEDEQKRKQICIIKEMLIENNYREIQVLCSEIPVRY